MLKLMQIHAHCEFNASNIVWVKESNSGDRGKKTLEKLCNAKKDQIKQKEKKQQQLNGHKKCILDGDSHFWVKRSLLLCSQTVSYL